MIEAEMNIRFIFRRSCILWRTYGGVWIFILLHKC